MNKVFVIAEMSANHCGKIDLAKKIIFSAKECGADAVKIQTYTADTLTIDCKNNYFKIKEGLWKGRYFYDLYKDAYTPWEWQKELKDFADSIGIELFSTPFDNTAVDFLENIGIQRYKIASFEAIDYNLVKYVALKNKPIIISTGISSLSEIEDVIEICKSVGNNDITLLKCTSSYPADLSEMNILTIADMIQRFSGVKIGLSDHSKSIEPVIAAIALGAKVIEKHFTIDKALGGADSEFSLDLQQFKEMVNAVRNTEKALGKIDYSINEKNRKGARSLFVVQDMNEGDIITTENVRSIRPSDGLHPKYLSQILGRKIKTKLDRGTPLNFDFIDMEG